MCRQDGRFTSFPKNDDEMARLKITIGLKSRQNGTPFSPPWYAFPEGLSTSYIFLTVDPFLCVLAVLAGCGARLCEV